MAVPCDVTMCVSVAGRVRDFDHGSSHLQAVASMKNGFVYCLEQQCIVFLILSKSKLTG